VVVRVTKVFWLTEAVLLLLSVVVTVRVLQLPAVGDVVPERISLEGDPVVTVTERLEAASEDVDARRVKEPETALLK